MFGYTDVHKKEQVAIERRRAAEEERKNRIFNPKVRVIGVDKQALDAQVEEKKLLKQMEDERDRFYDEQTIISSQHGQFLESKMQDVRREVQKTVSEYRQTQQANELRREFDLNDKDALKKELPVRVGDRDPRLGISAAQVFNGEDLGNRERSRAQKEQMKSWIEQNISEKDHQKALEEYEKLMYEKRTEEVNFLANEIEKQKELLRLEKLRANKEYNLEQLVEKRNREAEQKMRDEIDKLEEIQNQLNSDLLNENFHSTLHATDGNRFKPYNFKSLRPEQYQEIHEVREQQILEKEYNKAKQKMEDEMQHVNDRINDRMANRLKREQERLKQEKEKQLAEIHKKQMEQNKAKKNHIQDLYANEVTEDFFSQFGTSSR
ncbi:hypothetical protein AKO1_011382 [Acrasis kona]|uniref:RIB43A-like with coiled-coils protein 2 n=1 Tax=Acrasis kona TaxID=1008807 RepID=A0AAW2YYN3_9EUKA